MTDRVQLIDEGFNDVSHDGALSRPFALSQNYSTPVDAPTEINERSSYQTWAPTESSFTSWTRNSDPSSPTMATLQSPHLSRSTAGTASSYTAPAYDAPTTTVSTPVASNMATASSSAISSVFATSTI